ncbi:MAG: HPr family phosphocarrier protein [Deltaproteobacteria bacterium]|nr:HPr family phosphocarrier protein [Deltaproteobacteria bacterium]
MGKKISRGPQKSSTATGLNFSKSFRVLNTLGLHARAAALFVKLASRYKSEIQVSKGTNKVNGKSIMGILMLAAAKGSEIKVKTVGEDAKEALHELGKLIESGFGE